MPHCFSSGIVTRRALGLVPVFLSSVELEAKTSASFGLAKIGPIADAKVVATRAGHVPLKKSLGFTS